jgi:hypothetical protein
MDGSRKKYFKILPKLNVLQKHVFVTYANNLPQQGIDFFFLILKILRFKRLLTLHKSKFEAN